MGLGRPVARQGAGVREMPGRVRIYLVTAALGRLGVGMFPVSLILTAVHRGEGFAVAGASVGAFAVTAAALGPVRAQWVQKFGVRLSMLVLATVFGAANLGATLVSSGAGSAPGPPWMVIALGAVCGGSVPPYGPVIQRDLAETLSAGVREFGFSADSSLSSIANLLAPPAVVFLTGTAFPWGSLVSGSLVITSSIAVSILANARPATEGAAVSRRGLRRLWVQDNSIPLAFLTCVAALIGAVAGVLEISIPGAMAQEGRPDLAGWLLSAMLCSSAAASMIYGTISRPFSTIRIVRVLAVTLFASSLFLTTVVNAAAFAVLLVLVGAAIGVLSVVVFLQTARIASDRDKLLALSWVATANNVGTAVGSSSAGISFERAGYGLASFGAVVGSGMIAFLALGATRRYRTAETRWL